MSHPLHPLGYSGGFCHSMNLIPPSPSIQATMLLLLCLLQLLVISSSYDDDSCTAVHSSPDTYEGGMISSSYDDDSCTAVHSSPDTLYKGGLLKSVFDYGSHIVSAVHDAVCRAITSIVKDVIHIGKFAKEKLAEAGKVVYETVYKLADETLEEIKIIVRTVFNEETLEIISNFTKKILSTILDEGRK